MVTWRSCHSRFYFWNLSPIAQISCCNLFPVIDIETIVFLWYILYLMHFIHRPKISLQLLWLTHWGLMMHICTWRIGHHWFRQWLAAPLALSHWLSQCWIILNWNLKLRSHMRWAVAERRRADFDIPAPLPRVCSHIGGADVDGSAISWGQRWFGARGFEADAENWVLDPFVVEWILLRLRSATAYVWMHVKICVEANFPPASASVRSAHMWTYL